MRHVIFACALVAASLVATGAQARGYNCAVPADRPEGRWSMDQGLSMQVLGDITGQGLGAPGHYKFRFCGTVENGRKLVMVGAIAIKEAGPVCDAPENFAVFYDLTARTFTTPSVTGVNFCQPSVAPPAPTPPKP